MKGDKGDLMETTLKLLSAFAVCTIVALLSLIDQVHVPVWGYFLASMCGIILWKTS